MPSLRGNEVAHLLLPPQLPCSSCMPCRRIYPSKQLKGVLPVQADCVLLSHSWTLRAWLGPKPARKEKEEENILHHPDFLSGQPS